MNGEQQARIMSELPCQLDGIHQHVKRFKEMNDECFFEELCLFVEEEKNVKYLLSNIMGKSYYFTNQILLF